MSEEPKPGASPSDELQFDQVEFESSAPPSATCVVCGQPIRGVYYEVNGNAACTDCRDQLTQSVTGGSGRVGRFVRALVFGSIAAAIGAGIYYGVRAATNMEFGLIAIVVGLMVGGAVKKGSDARGGWFYQGMAMFLTYTAIVSTYVPFVVNEFVKAAQEHEAKQVADAKGQQPATEPKPKLSILELLAFIALVIGTLYAIPFLLGAHSIMGLIIIGIGLYEAWVLNRCVPLVITGPYRLGAANPIPPMKADHVEPGT